MEATLGILNVGAGDTKLSFNKSDPAECIRSSARIVTDMLRRGYALLVEVTHPGGEKKFQRVLEFDPEHCEYIIADFDPTVAAAIDAKESINEQPAQDQIEEGASSAPGETVAPHRAAYSGAAKAGRGRKRIPASDSRGVAIARSAGG